jgi:hypothetical protein
LELKLNLLSRSPKIPLVNYPSSLLSEAISTINSNLKSIIWEQKLHKINNLNAKNIRAKVKLRK